MEHDTERNDSNTVLLADCIMLERIPSKPGDSGGRASFEDTLESIDNYGVIISYFSVCYHCLMFNHAL